MSLNTWEPVGQGMHLAKSINSRVQGHDSLWSGQRYKKNSKTELGISHGFIRFRT